MHYPLVALVFLVTGKVSAMKTKEQEAIPQPEPFTPGITRLMVREHAFNLFRDRLQHGSLTLEDWVLAEKDLIHTSTTDGLSEF